MNFFSCKIGIRGIISIQFYFVFRSNSFSSHSVCQHYMTCLSCKIGNRYVLPILWYIVHVESDLFSVNCISYTIWIFSMENANITWGAICVKYVKSVLHVDISCKIFITCCRY
jgi:hypothetical protein